MPIFPLLQALLVPTDESREHGLPLILMNALRILIVEDETLVARDLEVF